MSIDMDQLNRDAADALVELARRLRRGEVIVTKWGLGRPEIEVPAKDWGQGRRFEPSGAISWVFGFEETALGMEKRRDREKRRRKVLGKKRRSRVR
jgi:hypothetical protein